MPIRAVMFDLDGTLADTLEDLARAGNHAMSAVGRPTFPVERYRTLAGQGLERLIRDALGPEHQPLFDPAITSFRGHYAAHRFDHTRPYDGVVELLDDLRSRGLPLAVMSNKPDDATVDTVARLFAAETFAAVRGHRAGYPVKPDPKAALEICDELGVPPESWAYVGDSDVDVHTGRAAGFFTVGVSWGFRSVDELRDAGAAAVIDRPAELLPLLRG
ncbi:MAG: HAD family hydrolase [Planctomycetota bacterium]